MGDISQLMYRRAGNTKANGYAMGGGGGGGGGMGDSKAYYKVLGEDSSAHM